MLIGAVMGLPSPRDQLPFIREAAKHVAHGQLPAAPHRRTRLHLREPAPYRRRGERQDGTRLTGGLSRLGKAHVMQPFGHLFEMPLGINGEAIESLDEPTGSHQQHLLSESRIDDHHDPHQGC